MLKFGNISIITYNDSITSKTIKDRIDEEIDLPDDKMATISERPLHLVFVDDACYRCFIQSLTPSERIGGISDDLGSGLVDAGYQVLSYRHSLVVLIMNRKLEDDLINEKEIEYKLHNLGLS